MLKGIFQWLLIKSGKTYTIDPHLPESLIIRNLFRRAVMLLRGLIFLQTKVYMGDGCSVINRKNINFGKNVTLENGTRIDGYASRKLSFGDGSRIGAHSLISSTSHLSKLGKGLIFGNNSAAGPYTEFGAAGGIQIGNDVIMGSFVTFHSENHNFNDPTKLIREQGVNSKGIIIENNVWVGAKVTFLDGSHIGNNCVIAAGAVVNGVFPDNVVIGGVPAKIIKNL